MLLKSTTLNDTTKQNILKVFTEN